MSQNKKEPEMEQFTSNCSDYDYSYIVIMLGESSVGKTSIIRRLLNIDGPTTTQATICVDVFYHFVNVDGERIRLEIRDTSGQERYGSITRNYYRNAQGVVLVYDNTNFESLKKLRIWLQDVRRICEDDSTQYMVVGNKVDLSNNLVDVVEELAQPFLKRSYNAVFIDTSALTGYNIRQAFYELAKALHSRRPPDPIEASKQETTGRISLHEVRKTVQQKCCKSS